MVNDIWLMIWVFGELYCNQWLLVLPMLQMGHQYGSLMIPLVGDDFWLWLNCGSCTVEIGGGLMK